MSTETIIARLEEMALYFAGCRDNAQADSKAWHTFNSFVLALRQVIDEGLEW